MTHPTQMVWEAAGRPPVEGGKGKLVQDHPGTCCISGLHQERTADAAKALGTNFVDRSCFTDPSSTRVGEPALWATSGRGRNTIRMFSILCAPNTDVGPTNPDAWLQNTPGLRLIKTGPERAELAAFLMDPPTTPWVVSVALSGQKHVLPYARTNHGTGTWTIRVEDTNITSTPEQWKTIWETALALRRLRQPNENIMEGIPGHQLDETTLPQWAELNQKLTPFLRSPILEFALWTITKETIND